MQNLLPQILAQQKSASGSTYTQLFAGCPSTVNNVDLATFNFLTWGINFTIPLTSFKIDIKPFESAACPIKTAVVFYNMIKP